MNLKINIHEKFCKHKYEISIVCETRMYIYGPILQADIQVKVLTNGPIVFLILCAKNTLEILI